jgi:hypothetical protein
VAVDVKTFTDAALRAHTEVLLELRELVAEELRNDPDSREELLEALERIRLDLREEGRSDIEDIVLDVMDFVTGWSSPHMRV